MNKLLSESNAEIFIIRNNKELKNFETIIDDLRKQI